MPIFNSTYLSNPSILLLEHIRKHQDINTCMFRVSERMFDTNSLLVIKNSTTRKSLHLTYVKGSRGVKVTFVTTNPNTPEYIDVPQVEDKVLELDMKADLFAPLVLEELLSFLYNSKHYPHSAKINAVSNIKDITPECVFAKKISLITKGGLYTTISFDDDTCVQKLNTSLEKYNEVLRPGCMYVENSSGLFTIRKYNHFVRSFTFKESNEYQTDLCKQP